MSIVLRVPQTAAIRARFGLRAFYTQASLYNKSQRPSRNDVRASLRPPSPVQIRRRGPHDLDQLRAPDEKYVARPVEDHSGNISLSKRINYWYRLAKSQQEFYEEGIRRAKENHEEAKIIRARLHPWYSGDAALSGGSKTPSGEVIPTITRKDFQILRRAPDDYRKLPLISLIVKFCGVLAPLVVRLVPISYRPRACLQKSDQLVLLRRLSARLDWVDKEIISWIEPSTTTRRRFQEIAHATGREKFLNRCIVLWLLAYLVRSHPLSRLIPYLPLRGRILLVRVYGQRSVAQNYHEEILEDTALVMREGGFGKLDPRDLADYCTRFGDIDFVRYWARQAVEKNELPASSIMVKHLAPTRDAYAKYLLAPDKITVRRDLRFLVDQECRLSDKIPGSFLGPSVQ
ncbi:hypothetical protein LTR84_011600 [Exophiala bonariae]|uniref:Letm1 RBD domain-containing protein n=1 Tax=Exophiala bonariae TaxID=1690606 RepID=A0AAV9NGF4_9EURO|nr:hypothetical protein LTR84_011600 [Exophiala bonariae]